MRADAKVLAIPIGGWHDPAAEEEAVGRLAGRDVRAIYFSTLRPLAGVRAAERAGIRVLYHFGDLSELATSSWLTGTVWRWSPLYLEVTRDLLSGKWSARHHEGGFREGMLGLASFGPAVRAETRKLAADLTGELASGERGIFFGPLSDATGKLRVPEGTMLDAGGIRAVDWFLEGVEVLPIDRP